MQPINLDAKSIKPLNKRQVVAKCSAWKRRNQKEISDWIAAANLPELFTLKAYDLWLFFDAVNQIKTQLPVAENKDELLADTEYYLRSICPISLDYKDGTLSYSRREYQE